MIYTLDTQQMKRDISTMIRVYAKDLKEYVRLIFGCTHTEAAFIVFAAYGCLEDKLADFKDMDAVKEALLNKVQEILDLPETRQYVTAASIIKRST